MVIEVRPRARRALLRATAATAFLAASIVASPAFASAFNIDFGQLDPAPSASFGAASGQTGFWNEIPALVPAGLVDTAGLPTGVTIFVTAHDGNWYPGPGDFNLLMDDNFYTDQIWTVTIAGLSNGSYTVFLYDPEHTGVGTGGGSVNTSFFSNINDPSVPGGIGSPDPNTTFTLGVNFLQLNVTVTNGTLTANGASGGLPAYSGLAGMQIVPGGVSAGPAVPEPASLVLLVTGAAAAAWRMRFAARHGPHARLASRRQRRRSPAEWLAGLTPSLHPRTLPGSAILVDDHRADRPIRAFDERQLHGGRRDEELRG